MRLVFVFLSRRANAHANETKILPRRISSSTTIANKVNNININQVQKQQEPKNKGNEFIEINTE